MKRTIGFLVVLALCWALVPAAVAHAQTRRDYCAEAREALERYYNLEIDLEAVQQAYRLCHKDRHYPPGTGAIPGINIPVRDPETGRLLPPENQIQIEDHERMFPVEELLEFCRCADNPRTYAYLYDRMFGHKTQVGRASVD